ncbi:MAG: hypothetical protein EA369_01075 [Bradymonadales bacterium]|nr:MAG: hypothetical protein EA369_01075 [Bradymonadales bacterium]
MLDFQKFDVASKEFYKLDAMEKALEALGQPQLGRPTILVTGTNAKGSLCYYLTALFRLLGWKVGTFVSPHVYERGERIQIDLRSSTEDELSKWEVDVREILEPLSFFERMTALAFLRFREEKVDVQIVEVGVGGRLDATNLCAPDLSILTSLSYDHQNLLGDTLLEIAQEKFGIARPGKPFWCAAELPLVVTKGLKIWAKDLGVELRHCPREFAQMDWESELRRSFPLVGEHQWRNLRLAILSFQDWCQRAQVSTPQFSDQLKALASVSIPGRMELKSYREKWIIDGGHNEEAIEALSRFLDQNFEGQSFDALFGCMKDKDWRKLLGPMRGRIRNLYLTSFFPEREMSPILLMESLKLSKAGNFDSVEQVLELSKFLKQRKLESRGLLVFGSFYLAGKVLTELRELEP